MRTSLIVGMLGAAALCLTVADAADAGSRRGGREGHGGRGLCGSGPTGINVEQRDARHAERRASLADAIELTDEQIAAWDLLREDAQQAKDDLCATGEVSREDARALRTSRHEAFVSILTQDQQEALKSLRQERRSARGPHDRRQQVRSILSPEQQQALAQLKADRPDGPRGGERAGRRARGHRLAEKLQLTQEQRDAMQDLRRVHRQQVQELRDGASREDLRALHQEHRDSMRQVLTEQQRQTLDQLRAARQSSKRRPQRERQLPPDGDPSLGGSARPGVEGTSWGDVKESVDGG